MEKKWPEDTCLIKITAERDSIPLANIANVNPTGELLPVDIAIAKGIKLAQSVIGVERICLTSALNRVCSESVHARLALPNFNNSAMDGYAVNTTMLSENGPYRLKVSGRMAAGDANCNVDSNPTADAIRILTGALVPDVYDAVIMQEKCTCEDDYIRFENCPVPGNNIRIMGKDCSPGDLVIAQSALIKPHHASLLAAQGHADVSVYRQVKVAFFSTGSELRQPGEELTEGQIYNSNRFALALQLNLPFVEMIDLGTIPDDPAQLKSALNDASNNADVVITTGGVSVGDEDHMPRLVGELGGRLHIMKVAIKPGKPVTIGTIKKAIYIGLPGNPVAAFVNQLLIGRSILEKVAGITPGQRSTQTVVSGFSRNSSVARQEYVLAKITKTTADGLPVVEVFEKSGSAALMPLAHSDGFVIIPMGVCDITDGQYLQFVAH